uniref:peptidylprolyl isomerase n=1 Tax=Strombidium inclinatum TaxID=197538 RepID=A0A7S3IRW7_9SPIT|mmetsp:Transcript_33375/g.51188  ORF Transcript_33375/g.51188 Transcript_33375/m.51188 type:complete len:158 (+) Transcript_33375:126-599(+)
MKDYKKAISKYVRIQLYIKPLVKQEGGEADPTVAMMTSLKKSTLSQEETDSCTDLMSTAFLNSAICHHMLGNLEKAKESASKSLSYKKTIKGYYRLGQACKALTDYDGAIAAYKQAIFLDTEDPNDIQTELSRAEGLKRKKDKEADAKLSGFLKNGL